MGLALIEARRPVGACCGDTAAAAAATAGTERCFGDTCGRGEKVRVLEGGGVDCASRHGAICRDQLHAWTVPDVICAARDRRGALRHRSAPDNTMSVLADQSPRRSGRAPDDASWVRRIAGFSRCTSSGGSMESSMHAQKIVGEGCDLLDRLFDRLVASFWEHPRELQQNSQICKRISDSGCLRDHCKSCLLARCPTFSHVHRTLASI